MNKLFSKIFFIELSQWEAELAAIHIVEQIEFEAALFEMETARKIRDGVIKLGGLPRVWAHELAHSILADERGYASL